MDFMESVIDDILESDHRLVVLERGEVITDAIEDQMEADGYEFACSPAANKVTGQRKVYFTREHDPKPRM